MVYTLQSVCLENGPPQAENFYVSDAANAIFPSVAPHHIAVKPGCTRDFFAQTPYHMFVRKWLVAGDFLPFLIQQMQFSFITSKETLIW